jgi:hypothetical protein
MVSAMAAAGTPGQVAEQLAAFGEYADHVIVYPATFGMRQARSHQVAQDVLAAGAPR